MNSTTKLGRPIVVHHSIVVCDQYSEHEFSIVTDGRRAYASTTDGRVETEEFWRIEDTSRIAATCPCRQEFPRTSEDQCTGQLVVDLTSPGWTADPEKVATFENHADFLIEH